MAKKRIAILLAIMVVLSGGMNHTFIEEDVLRDKDWADATPGDRDEPA